MAPLPKRRRLLSTKPPFSPDSTSDVIHFIPNPVPLPDTLILTPSTPTQTQNTLLPRQTSANSVFILTSSYSGLNTTSTPGTVAGIVLGVVGALCFVLWILSLVANIGQGGISDEVIVTQRPVPGTGPELVVKREGEEEMAEIRRPRRTRRPRRETVLVDERDEEVEVQQEDVIEVIEEEDDYDRERERERRRRRRTEGGYRTVDPDAYAGGDGRTRRVR